jgi:hypothetical protein
MNERDDYVSFISSSLLFFGTVSNKNLIFVLIYFGQFYNFFIPNRFPQEPCLKEKWIKRIQEEQRDEKWLPTKFSRICSSHFTDDMLYLTPTGRRKIKKNAIPVYRVFNKLNYY